MDFNNFLKLFPTKTLAAHTTNIFYSGLDIKTLVSNSQTEKIRQKYEYKSA